MIRVWLPVHLRNLARVGREVELRVEAPVTQRAVLDALEAQFPMLSGTVRDQPSKQRRAFIRFFACGQDLSLEPPDAPLPDDVVSGKEPFMIIGAMAGGAGRRSSDSAPVSTSHLKNGCTPLRVLRADPFRARHEHSERFLR